ncbi:hypothetical protein F5Y14DRAFT_449615 [Nemania sp. NC0429]|nr:hypothetical protein F5Y14DRAFT_449615 [Nemania sp. NC0429]
MMKSIGILMGFIAVMAGATAPYTRSSDYVLKCTTTRRQEMCTTGGRRTYCDVNGRLRTTDADACGDGWCDCRDYRQIDVESSSFKASDVVGRQLLPGNAGDMFFKQGF